MAAGGVEQDQRHEGRGNTGRGRDRPTRAVGVARGEVQQEQREGQVNRRDREREAAEGAGLDKRQRGQDKRWKGQNASPRRGGINGRGRIDNGLMRQNG